MHRTCTVGIAISRASKEATAEVEEIILKLSPNIFKNGMRVGIPGTSEKGMPFAIALAVICGNSEYGLEVFKDVCDHDVKLASEFLKKKSIIVQVEDSKANFYIEANLITHNENIKCVIEDYYTNIVLVEKDGKAVFESKQNNKESSNEIHKIGFLTIKELREVIETIPFKNIKFLLEGVKVKYEND